MMKAIILIAIAFSVVNAAEKTSTNSTTAGVTKTKDSRGKRNLNLFGNYGASRRNDGYNYQSSGYNYEPSNYIGGGSAPADHHYPEAPEPIIEIIIQDNNETLPPPEPIYQGSGKKKKEQVQVFYVKYHKDEHSGLIIHDPIPALTPVGHAQEDEYEDDQPIIVTPIPQLPQKSTTLRTIIRPDSQQYESDSGVHVTFGSPHNHLSKSDNQIHDEDKVESAIRPVVQLPQKRIGPAGHSAKEKRQQPQTQGRVINGPPPNFQPHQSLLQRPPPDFSPLNNFVSPQNQGHLSHQLSLPNQDSSKPFHPNQPHHPQLQLPNLQLPHHQQQRPQQPLSIPVHHQNQNQFGQQNQQHILGQPQFSQPPQRLPTPQLLQQQQPNFRPPQRPAIPGNFQQNQKPFNYHAHQNQQQQAQAVRFPNQGGSQQGQSQFPNQGGSQQGQSQFPNQSGPSQQGLPQFPNQGGSPQGLPQFQAPPQGPPQFPNQGGSPQALPQFQAPPQGPPQFPNQGGPPQALPQFQAPPQGPPQFPNQGGPPQAQLQFQAPPQQGSPPNFQQLQNLQRPHGQQQPPRQGSPPNFQQPSSANRPHPSFNGRPQSSDRPPQFPDRGQLPDRPQFPDRPGQFPDRGQFPERPPPFSERPGQFPDRGQFSERPPPFSDRPGQFPDSPQFPDRPAQFPDRPQFANQGPPPSFRPNHELPQLQVQPLHQHNQQAQSFEPNNVFRGGLVQQNAPDLTNIHNRPQFQPQQQSHPQFNGDPGFNHDQNNFIHDNFGSDVQVSSSVPKFEHHITETVNPPIFFQPTAVDMDRLHLERLQQANQRANQQGNQQGNQQSNHDKNIGPLNGNIGNLQFPQLPSGESHHRFSINPEPRQQGQNENQQSGQQNEQQREIELREQREKAQNQSNGQQNREHAQNSQREHQQSHQKEVQRGQEQPGQHRPQSNQDQTQNHQIPPQRPQSHREEAHRQEQPGQNRLQSNQDQPQNHQTSPQRPQSNQDEAHRQEQPGQPQNSQHHQTHHQIGSVSNHFSEVFPQVENSQKNFQKQQNFVEFNGRVNLSVGRGQPSPPPSASPTTAKRVEATTTQQPAPSSTEKPNYAYDLPDEVPDDLREQLLSSGILQNAQISVLDYDKIGDTSLQDLPAEHLANFFSAGGGSQIGASNKVISVLKPNGDSIDEKLKTLKNDREVQKVLGNTKKLPSYKEDLNLKVVKFDSQSQKNLPDQYIQKDSKILPTVNLENNYNRYLPLKINGDQFPIPDVEELRGKIISSVVVLAPVNADEEEERFERDTLETKQIKFIGGDSLKNLLRKPSTDNFRKWLEKEQKTNPDLQSVVLLVTKDNTSGEQEIFMYDIISKTVSRLSGELSSKFVDVAEENIFDETSSASEQIDRIDESIDEDSEAEAEAAPSNIIESVVNLDSSPITKDDQPENKIDISSGYSVIKSE